MKIGFIGVGKMSTAIIKGLASSQHQVFISGRDPEKTKKQALELGVTPCFNHEELMTHVDLIILGVKPQVLDPLLKELSIQKPIMSMAAGISLERLASYTHPDLPIMRIMPNLNAQILKSTTAICRNAMVDDNLYQEAQAIVRQFGACFDISEKDFDTFTALAGSSPAYLALFTDAFAKAGVKHGFNKQLALAIVTQTFLATSELLLEEKPSDLMEKVASPGGITIAGLLDFEKTGLTASVVSAIDTTIEKSKNL